MTKWHFYRQVKRWSPLIFFVLITFINLTLIYLTYEGYKINIVKFTRERVQNLAYTGAGLLDVNAYEKLVSSISPDFNYSKIDSSADILLKDAYASMEKSADYKKISDQLNRIRTSQPDLIMYVYTLIPTADGNIARFVVDADVLQPGANVNPDTKISHFSLKYDISKQPVTIEALRGQLNITDTEFRGDPEYDSVSMMGFSPIFNSSNKFLGVLGIDVTNTNMQKSLEDVQNSFLISTIIAILLSLGASIAAGYIIRGLILTSESAEIEYRRKIQQMNQRNLDSIHRSHN